MNQIFLGKLSHWLLLVASVAILYGMGMRHLHVRAFPVFVLLVLALVVAVQLWVVLGYKPGDAITREPIKDADSPPPVPPDGK